MGMIALYCKILCLRLPLKNGVGDLIHEVAERKENVKMCVGVGLEKKGRGENARNITEPREMRLQDP